MNLKIKLRNRKLKAIIFFNLLLFIFSFSSRIYGAEELNIYSNDVIAIDAESGNILYNKNGTSKVYPASTTKILTAIIAIEHLNLDDSIVCSKNAIYSTPFESSSMYLRVGEVVTVKELLYGLLLQSGNDAANVLAEAVSGNIDDFVKLMNEKLKEIGCTQTNFVNTHGFHDKDHYTTPYDMAKIMQYAIKNKTFKEFIETKSTEIKETNKTPEIRYYSNTNKLISSKSEYYYEYCLGGKTGYTEEARGTFVGYGEKDGKKVIVATFDASQNISGKQGRFLDSITLFNYCFSNYDKNIVVRKDDFKFTIRDEKNSKIYTISLPNDVYALYKKSELNTKYTFNLLNNINFDNIKEGSEIGTLEIDSSNATSNINTTSSVICSKITNYTNYSKLLFSIGKILIILLLSISLLYLLFCYFRKIKNRNREYNKNIYYNMNRNLNKRSKRINKF